MCSVCLWLLSSFPQASGDRSKLILIWEAQSCQHLYTFTGHRDAVSVRLWVFSGCLLRGPTWCWAPAHLLGTSPLGSECCGRVLSVLKTLGEMEGDQVQLVQEPGGPEGVQLFEYRQACS